MGYIAEKLEFLKVMSGPGFYEVYNVIAVFTTDSAKGTPSTAKSSTNA